MDVHSLPLDRAAFARVCRGLAARAPRWVGTCVVAALLGPVSVASAFAQSEACVSALNTCMAGCSAAGALGGLLGGGGGNAAAQHECRSVCGARRRECEVRNKAEASVPSAPARAAQPRTADAAPALPAQAQPSPIRGNPSSVGPETIVLMTIRPKDPFDARAAQRLAYGQKVDIVVFAHHAAVSKEEAQRLMQPEWKWRGPFVDNDPGLALLQGGSVMTRNKFVEAALVRYESQGGRRSNVRIDVLSGGNDAVANRLDTAPRAALSHSTQGATTPARSTTEGADCLTFRPSTKLDQRGEANYFLIKNSCRGPAVLARGKNSRSCWPGGNVRPGSEGEFHRADVHAICVHPGAVSVEKAIEAQVDCNCPAGSASIEHAAFPNTKRR